MFPLALAGGALGLGKALFGGLSANKKAKEQNRANQAGFEARKTRFGADEGMRSARLGGMQKFLQNYQGSLASDAPQYGMDPETLANLQAARPYAEAAPADVSKGGGSALISGLMGAGADIANTAALGQGPGAVDSQGFTPTTQFYHPDDYEKAFGIK